MLIMNSFEESRVIMGLNTFCSANWCDRIDNCIFYDYHTCECVCCSVNYFMALNDSYKCHPVSLFKGCSSADGVYCSACENEIEIPNHATQQCENKDPFCLAAEQSTCSGCVSGYYYDSIIGKCKSYIKDICQDYCTTCVGPPFSCQCQSGYIPQNNPTNSNVHCIDPDGYSYGCSNANCDQCLSNFTLISTGFLKSPLYSCIPKSFVHHCKTFQSSKCFECQDGYLLVNFNENLQCISLSDFSIPHCKTYVETTSNYQGCAECETGYYIYYNSFIGLKMCVVVDNYINIYSSRCMEYTLINPGSKQFECYSCGIGSYSERMTCRKCEYHCLKCFSLGHCLLCEIGYFVQNGVCVKLRLDFLSYCTTFDEKYGCVECNNSNAQGNCVECPTYCEKCYLDSNGIMGCSKCLPEFHLFNGSCVGSTISHCISFDNSNSVCNKCQIGYYNMNGQCEQCPTSCDYCHIASEMKISCDKCQNGFIKHSDDGVVSCVKTIENCKSVISDECIECDDGYYLNKQNKCLEAPFHCLKFNFESQQCMQCETDSNNIDGICTVTENCQVNNSLGSVYEYFLKTSYCKFFGLSTKKCDVCNDNYFLLSDGSCKSNSLKINSKQEIIGHCVKTSTSGCVRCENKYFFNFNTKSCEPCHSSCNHCSGPSEMECLVCDKFHYYFEGKCLNTQQLIDKCQTLISLEQVKICLKCKEGYVKEGFDCIKCPDNCVNCFDDKHCVSCNESYYLKNAQCSSFDQLTNCSTKTKFGCSQCDETFFINKDSECEKCSGQCVECNQNNCLKCNQSHVLIDKSKCIHYSSIQNCIESLNSKCTKCQGMFEPDIDGKSCLSSPNYFLIIGIPILVLILIIIVTSLIISYFIHLHFVYYFNRTHGVTPLPIKSLETCFFKNKAHKHIRCSYTTLSSSEEIGVGNETEFELVVGNHSRFRTYEIHIATPIDNIKCLFNHVPDCGDIPPGKAIVFKVSIKPLVCCCISNEIGVVVKSRKRDVIIPIKIKLYTQLNCSLDPDEIHEEKQIGEGSFGAVFKGEFRKNVVAIKKLKIILINQNIEEFNKEVELLDKFRCPQIVYFYGAVFNPKRLTIVMEFAPFGSLRCLVENKPIEEFPIELRIKLLFDCSKGLMYLHNNHIIHRDVKTDNILVFDLNKESLVTAKLTDFGSSRSITFVQSNMTFTKGIGTPIYMAPDILNRTRYDEKVDVYSFAVVMYECFIWGDLYAEEEFPFIWNIASFIAEGKRKPKHPLMEEWYWKLIDSGWSQNPKDRLTMEQMVREFEKHNC